MANFVKIVRGLLSVGVPNPLTHFQIIYLCCNYKQLTYKRNYPAEYGQEGKEYGSDDIWFGKREHFVGLSPRICHDDESDGIE